MAVRFGVIFITDNYTIEIEIFGIVKTLFAIKKALII